MTQAISNLESYRETAIGVVQDVFGTMLGVDVQARETGPTERPSHPVVGAVYLAGGWKGAVHLELECQQSFRLTAKLMAMEPPTSMDDDVRDAVAELANMIAGNLKSLLPSDTVLSMPSVVEGSDFSLKVLGSNESVRLEFDSSDGPFRVTLVQVLDY